MKSTILFVALMTMACAKVPVFQSTIAYHQEIVIRGHARDTCYTSPVRIAQYGQDVIYDNGSRLITFRDVNQYRRKEPLFVGGESETRHPYTIFIHFHSKGGFYMQLTPQGVSVLKDPSNAPEIMYVVSSDDLCQD